MEEPYMTAQEAPRLPTLPHSTEAKIAQVQGRVGLLGRNDAATQPLHVFPTAYVNNETEAEAQRFREDYRSSRVRQDHGGPNIKREEDMDDTL